MSEKWNKRPDWLMPDKTSGQQIDSSQVDKELITGFNFALSTKEVRQLIRDKGFDYKKGRMEKKSKIQTYIFEGALFDTENLFTYRDISSTVDFFDGILLSSRVLINASNEENLEEIVNAVYQILIDFYETPSSESSIYSFQTYKWINNDLEVFLSIDKEDGSVLISEVNSAVEESRSFQEFKDKYIEEYQTYEEEIRYGKKRER
ncbi:MAG: hypothetical protein CMN79_05450 [Spirochaetales bacterium]|nr:hypothetical protein [Spirochaetales bacterium]|tara:strand:- start:3920 stop:4534 length:615 start_codon:yes stop_codon:yes gene_type:complete